MATPPLINRSLTSRADMIAAIRAMQQYLSPAVAVCSAIDNQSIGQQIVVLQKYLATQPDASQPSGFMFDPAKVRSNIADHSLPGAIIDLQTVLGGTGGNSPANSVAPVIIGNTQVGQAVGTTNGSWSNSPTGYTYQWKRGGTNITSATANTYTLAEADAGQSITCDVTASNASGSATATGNSLLIDVYVVFLTSIVDPTDLTTYSGGVWNSVNFGVAAPNRNIVLSIGGRNTTAARTIASASFGGVSAAASAAALNGGSSNVATIQMWSASVPTGTSGNLSITWSGAQLRCGAGVYAVYGAASNTANASVGVVATAALDTTGTMNLPNGAGVIGYSFVNGGTPTWDIGTAQNFSATVESTIAHSGASGVYSGAGTVSVGMAWGTNPDLSAPIIFAAWAPSGATTNANDVILSDGGRTWFNTPSSALVSGSLWAGAINRATDIIMGNGSTTTTLHANIGNFDDHNNPGWLFRSSDSRAVLGYATHSIDTNYYIRIGTNPNDLTSFGAEVNIGAVLDPSGLYNKTYCNIVEVTDGIFLFYRGQVIADGTFKQFFSKSTDGGVTWSVGTVWFDGPDRPYFQMTKTAANRFDIVCNGGNPNQAVLCSLYHFYYEAGTWKKSDGTSIGSPPFALAQFTVIYTDPGSSKSWPWDVKFIGGTLRAVYAQFPGNTYADHRYRYASLSNGLAGGTWTDNEACTGGTGIYPAAGGENFYSGGITLDPDDATKIYCSRQVGSATHQLFKGVTADGGVTFTLTQLTAGGEKKFRPSKIAGTSFFSYVLGRYTSYTSWTTRIQKLTG